MVNTLTFSVSPKIVRQLTQRDLNIQPKNKFVVTTIVIQTQTQPILTLGYNQNQHKYDIQPIIFLVLMFYIRPPTPFLTLFISNESGPGPRCCSQRFYIVYINTTKDKGKKVGKKRYLFLYFGRFNLKRLYVFKSTRLVIVL